jgi:hypothetical protein
MYRCLITVMALFLTTGGAVAIASDSPRYFLFQHRGVAGETGQWVAATGDEKVLKKVAEQLTLPIAERTLHINGVISAGNGGHNLRWRWHFTPSKWNIVSLSIELCDGTPQMVEKNVQYWVKKVKTFCPWSSYVLREITPKSPIGRDRRSAAPRISELPRR